ncbi:DUF2911 domain-containing protein [Aquimarina spongiae]|uniref:DUF2911 domain-containing protein n=1 Tax=Aquimarina spongiae TaxID=570521 RepID=A0A1M6JSF2_9FLAO|nr:DUF2911 domain-containing protein [Aquimarina spongiae]SHJ49593.1 Protein of unknown function [Aquimarina spongiae]
MFKTFVICVLSVCAVQAQLTIPALSPSSKTIQTIGITDIELEYSRPSQRGRTLFGAEGLLPYGTFWRTGANAATKITVSDDITIQGSPLKKGTYAILSKPNNTYWDIYLYTYDTGNWNTYTSRTPVLQLKANVTNQQNTVESFLMYLDQIELDSADLVFAWGNVRASLSIKVEVHEKTMANIKKVLSGPSDFDYFLAALYLHEANTDLEQALQYIQKVTKSEKALFFQVYREALILGDLGRKKEALVAAKRSLVLSEKAKNEDLIRLNRKLIQEWSK